MENATIVSFMMLPLSLPLLRLEFVPTRADDVGPSKWIKKHTGGGPFSSSSSSSSSSSLELESEAVEVSVNVS